MRAHIFLVILMSYTTAFAGDGRLEFGGWRNVRADSDDASLQDLTFAMLPSEVRVGTRLLAYDHSKRRLVCCFQVMSSVLHEDVLRKKYQLPEVRITDLTNGWSETKPYAPLIQQLRRVGDLVNYKFGSDSGSLGGLLTSYGATLVNGKLRYEKSSFTVTRKIDALGGDDGAIETFVVTQADPKGVSGKRIEVPYGTW